MNILKNNYYDFYEYVENLSHLVSKSEKNRPHIYIDWHLI